MSNSAPQDFVVLILTHGRPDKVYTHQTLRRQGYTGPIYLVIDNLDKKRKEYEETYGENVIVFDKPAIAQTFDNGDNFGDYRAIIYARNAAFQIARQLGYKYFIQLDDDYTNFSHRFDRRLDYHPRVLRNLNAVFSALLRFYQSTPIHSVALSQGGDFIGGPEAELAQRVTLKRKCMNSFICSTEREFQFIGRVNEDVNTYTRGASTGLLFFTVNQVSLQQKQTQTNSGGMTEMYLDSGTFVKSFYTVMYQPSSVTIKMLQSKNARLHHSVDWARTVPKILSEKWKKTTGDSAC